MTPYTYRRCTRATIEAFAALAILSALSATASAKKPRPPAVVEAAAQRETGEPVMAIVSIKTQEVVLYDAEGWILRAPVSTGVKGRETPAGVFAVVEKKVEHHSNLYDDAFMPHMQRLTWNGIAMHGGPLPGYAASHGCVRLPFGFAETLFDKTRTGMRVIVSPTDAVPVDISHSALLRPDAKVVAAAPALAESLAAQAQSAAQSAADTKKLAADLARIAASSNATLKKLERSASTALSELASAEKAVSTAKTDQAKVRAEERRLKATAKSAEAAAKRDAALPDAQSKSDAAAAAKLAATEAAKRKVDAAHAASEAKLALEPVAIYISRATQKLYVRRNTRKPWADGGEVYDSTIEVPVTIENPEQPIGTHVFTAMASTGTGLRWAAVTIDGGDTAERALDRIVIPQEVLDRVAPNALPRSSIIVSDEPPSRETNYRTEFVAVLSNQPQGGFITRKPTVPAPRPVETWDDYNGGFFSMFDPPPPPRQGKAKRRQVQKEGWWW